MYLLVYQVFVSKSIASDEQFEVYARELQIATGMYLATAELWLRSRWKHNRHSKGKFLLNFAVRSPRKVPSKGAAQSRKSIHEKRSWTKTAWDSEVSKACDGCIFLWWSCFPEWNERWLTEKVPVGRSSGGRSKVAMRKDSRGNLVKPSQPSRSISNWPLLTTRYILITVLSWPNRAHFMLHALSNSHQRKDDKTTYFRRARTVIRHAPLNCCYISDVPWNYFLAGSGRSPAAMTTSKLLNDAVRNSFLTQQQEDMKSDTHSSQDQSKLLNLPAVVRSHEFNHID